MLHSNIHTIDSLFVSIYDFENIGDLLPLHTHDADSAHITIVARGSFRVLSDDTDAQPTIISAGNLLDVGVNCSHGFEALEPNGRLINVIKHHRF